MTVSPASEQALTDSAAVIEEVSSDDWDAGTFRILYTGQGHPWHIGRIESRPASTGANDKVRIFWYDRNKNSTTRFSHAPIQTRSGIDAVLVKSFGPVVTQFTAGRSQDFIDITEDELARINEAVKDWDAYEDSADEHDAED